MGCRETAEMWDKLGRTDADSLYASACLHAVAAGVFIGGGEAARQDAETEAVRALEQLKKSVAQGYDAFEHLKSDSDLVSLRGRKDFQEWLAAVGPKAGLR